MAEGGFDFKKFLDETKATLVAPAEYFAVMPKEGGFGEPLVKAVIYSLIAGIIGFIFSFMHLSAFSGLFGSSVGIFLIINSLIFGIIGLFIGGAIILVISSICGGNTNYETNVRVTASLMAIYPVQALLSFLTGINIWIGQLVFLAIALYGLYMLYIAVTKSLEGKNETAKIISIVLAVIPTLMVLSSLLCMKAASNLQDNMMKKMPIENQEQLNKLQEQINKAIEESKKEEEEGDKE